MCTACSSLHKIFSCHPPFNIIIATFPLQPFCCIFAESSMDNICQSLQWIMDDIWRLLLISCFLLILQISQISGHMDETGWAGYVCINTIWADGKGTYVWLWHCSCPLCAMLSSWHFMYSYICMTEWPLGQCGTSGWRYYQFVPLNLFISDTLLSYFSPLMSWWVKYMNMTLLALCSQQYQRSLLPWLRPPPA